jgi:hypothetical protein
MRRIFSHICDGHLMCAPKAFEFVSVDFGRRCPTFGRTQNDHGPAGPSGNTRVASFALNRSNALHAIIQRRRHGLMHRFRIRTFHKAGRVAVALEQVRKFFMAYSRQQSGIINLVAV